jgi:hypothetical protein
VLLVCSCGGAQLSASRVRAYFRDEYGPGARLGACRKVGPPTRGVAIYRCFLRRGSPKLFLDLDSISGPRRHVVPTPICFVISRHEDDVELFGYVRPGNRDAPCGTPSAD